MDDPDPATMPDPATVPAPPTAVGVLLAAGGGTRFDGPSHKLLSLLPATTDRPEETVMARSLARLVAALDESDTETGLWAIVVVTGASEVDDALATAPEAARHRLHVADNARWSDGQATSLRCGIDAVDALGSDVAIIGLADQPGVDTATWRAVAAAALRPGAPPINVATYDGRPRNPVSIHRSLWHELPSTGDIGARDLIRGNRQLVRQIPSTGSPDDIDTVEDLTRWLNS